MIFPTRCPYCKEIADDKNIAICKECLTKLTLVKKPYCLKCGRHIEDEKIEYCTECNLHPKTYEFGMPLLSYDDISAPVMYDIKYNNKRDYIKTFAKMIYVRWKDKIKSLNIERLIPIPIHEKRRRERGYNQAEDLAFYLSEYLNIELDLDLLYRIKNTKAQKELNPYERLKNLKEAFYCDEAYKALNLKRVLLVDDIYTTGSTIEACSLALKSVGIEKVYYTSICIVEE